MLKEGDNTLPCGAIDCDGTVWVRLCDGYVIEARHQFSATRELHWLVGMGTEVRTVGTL